MKCSIPFCDEQGTKQLARPMKYGGGYLWVCDVHFDDFSRFLNKKTVTKASRPVVTTGRKDGSGNRQVGKQE